MIKWLTIGLAWFAFWGWFWTQMPSSLFGFFITAALGGLGLGLAIIKAAESPKQRERR